MDRRFSRPALRAFEAFFRPWMSTRVHAVKMVGLPDDLPPDRPILFAPNHVSWWDGFVTLQIRRALRPRAPIYTLMTEAELRRFPYFRRIGALGIERRQPTSIARALRFLAAQMAERSDTMLVVFPQGRIWPSHRRPLGFERGIELFARRLQPLILPIGIHVEPLNRASPTIFAAIGEPLGPAASAREVEAAVEEELDRILDFISIHGEDAATAWPPVHCPAGADSPRVPRPS